MHYIQKHILKVLTYTKYARFSEMRPPRIDSNAYSYHLKVLLRENYVEKTDKGYRLSPHGLGYVDRISAENFEPRLQPKVITMSIVRNEEDKVLLWSKKKQPFITAWSLPSGKVHITDRSMEAAAIRESVEKFGGRPKTIEHNGSCFIRASINSELISYVLAHIFTITFDEGATVSENTGWYDANERHQLKLLPATEEIIQKAAIAKQLFFEEYDVDW